MGIRAISVTLNELNMAVGAGWAAVLGVTQTADGLGFFFSSLGFTEDGSKKRKYRKSCSCVEENPLLMSEV